MINEPFLLIESDLVFDPDMLKDMLHPDRIAVARLQPWMNGTTVTINNRQKVEAFCADDAHKHDGSQYKTVNIYSLSSMTWQLVQERLDRHISNNMVNDYYETVFSDMVNEGCLSFTPVFFDPNRWYEIDTLADLRAAEQVSGLHHRPPVIVTDHVVSNQKGPGYYPPALAFKDLEAIDRIKKPSRRHPGIQASAPKTAVSTLPQ